MRTITATWATGQGTPPIQWDSNRPASRVRQGWGVLAGAATIGKYVSYPARWFGWDASRQDEALDRLWGQILNRGDTRTRPLTELSAKGATVCMYSAAGLGVWEAYGLPTYGIGVGRGVDGTGLHFVFGASQGGAPMVWGHSVGTGTVMGASSEFMATAWTLEGIPIFAPGAIYAMNRASENCAVATTQAYVTGIIGQRAPGVVYGPNMPWNK